MATNPIVLESPVILDDTGARIASAIEYLGDIQVSEYTFVDGTNSFTVVPKGGTSQIVHVYPSIASISVNNTGINPDSSGNVNISVPTTVSELGNDLNFASENYVNTAIQNAITNAIAATY